MKGRVAVMLIGIVAATSGCVTTIGDLRHAKPDRTARAIGEYQALAGCVTEGLQTSSDGFFLEPGDLLYQTVLRPDEKRMVVTGLFSGGRGSPTPLIYLTFRQVDSESVVIESRWGGFFTTRKAAERIDARVWPIAQRCARGHLELAPPM